MGVRKFRSVAEMPPPAPRTPLDPKNLREVCALMELTRRLSRFSFVPGVRKFRSAEEADAHRRAWEAEETRRLAAANVRAS
jgi:hypothetical protein